MKISVEFPIKGPIKVLLTVALIAAAGALGLSSSFYSEALIDAFFAFALASVVILHMRVRPKWSDGLLIVAGGCFLGIVDFQILHYPARVMAAVSFLGLSSFLVMAIRAVWAKDQVSTRDLLYAWVPSLLFVASDYFATTMLEWTGIAHPKTLDGYLLSFDYSLRIPLVFLAGQLYAMKPWLHNASLLAYVGLAIPIAVVYGGRLVRFKEKAVPAMLAFLVTGPVGILFYNLFPACGPHALFQQNFPFHVFPIDQVRQIILEPVAIQGARNAIPSLHMAWVLLAWWYSRGLGWIERGIALAFLVLTMFATLGTGEHWLVDLIVAFPFALSIQAICAYSVSWRDRERRSAFAFGVGCTLAWLAALRYAPGLFWTSPVVPWALAVATVAVTIIRQQEFFKCTDPAGAVAEPEASASQVVKSASVAAN